MYCDITNYGAVPNTGAVNTKAIQAAIDDCSRNGSADRIFDGEIYYFDYALILK